MPTSKLLAISIENFKSLFTRTRVEFGLLTVFVGKNNSGKSTITQALLLLKQTLSHARVDIPLTLEGFVTALNLRELTSGWPVPDKDGFIAGPKFSIEWSSEVDLGEGLAAASNPDLYTLATQAGFPKLLDDLSKRSRVNLFTRLDLSYSELNGRVNLDYVDLFSSRDPSFEKVGSLVAHLRVQRNEEGGFECRWNDEIYKRVEVDLHHFLPSLSIDRRNMGPRSRARTIANAYQVLFAQPLDSLDTLLKNFAYLSSTRSVPPPFYPPGTFANDELGISAEFAAQLLYAYKDDLVHYLLPDFDNINSNFVPKEKTLVDALNEVLGGLGIDTPLSIDEIEKVGFRLMLGNATLAHVGRGLTYLVPIIQLGLFSDPERVERNKQRATDSHGNSGMRLCAFEEPEAHLHPRVQSRLAAWFVALAQAGRQIMTETHSDHLVRRLRAMLARAPRGSQLEKWLSENVRVVDVSQVDGRTAIKSSLILKDGGLEIWPDEFMDVAVKDEKEIYYDALEKEESRESEWQDEIVHESSEEPDDCA